MEFVETKEDAPEDRHFIKLKVRDSVFGDLFKDLCRAAEDIQTIQTHKRGYH